MGLNESASFAMCDAPDCRNSIQIPNARLGVADAALNWLPSEGWGVEVKDDETYCPRHPSGTDHLRAPTCARCGAQTNIFNRGLPICVERHLQVAGREATPEEQSVLDRYLVANVRFIVACRDPGTPVRYGRREEWSGMDLRKARDMRKYVSDELVKYRTSGSTGTKGAGMLEARRHVEVMDLCVDAIKSYLDVVKIVAAPAP